MHMYDLENEFKGGPHDGYSFRVECALKGRACESEEVAVLRKKVQGFDATIAKKECSYPLLKFVWRGAVVSAIV